MSNARRILCLKLECSLFNRIALFCAAGLMASFTLAMVYDLRIAEQWL